MASEHLPTDGRLRRAERLHIIDACQAFDLPVSFKYERNFGSIGGGYFGPNYPGVAPCPKHPPNVSGFVACLAN